MSNGIVTDDDIKEALEKHKKNAINSFNNDILNISEILEIEDLIKVLFNCRIKAIEVFNEIFTTFPDSFNNPEYLSWYNEAKGEVEGEFDEMENKKIKENNETSDQENKELLEEEYKTIEKKINEHVYTSQNCQGYLKDYETFLSNYSKKAKGCNKVSNLSNFIADKKPIFIKEFIGNLSKENKLKLSEMSKKLEESEKAKKKAEEEFNNLNEQTEENTKKIEDLNSEIQKKKREIKNLNEKIEQITDEIKNAQREDSQIRKIKNNESFQS